METGFKHPISACSPFPSCRCWWCSGGCFCSLSPPAVASARTKTGTFLKEGLSYEIMFDWSISLPSPCPADDPQQHWKLLKPQEKENKNQWLRIYQAQQDNPGCCCSVDGIKYDNVNVTGFSPSVPADATGPSGIPGWGPGREMSELITVPLPLLLLSVCNETQRSATLILIRRNVLLFPERNQDRKESELFVHLRNLRRTGRPPGHPPVAVNKTSVHAQTSARLSRAHLQSENFTGLLVCLNV